MTFGLLTDQYELTMLEAALAAGKAKSRCAFEVFTRHLPAGRRYGVLAGTGRILDALDEFRFDAGQIGWLRENGIVAEQTLDYLADFRFRGTISGYAEGELFFPSSPVLRVEGTFAEVVLLETFILSVLNHDSAVASAASRMTWAAQDRPCIEMGSRRTHDAAAVHSARAAAIAGFASTSNLEAGYRYGIGTSGTSAHAFTLLFDDEDQAFTAQIDSFGVGTTLLVDTYDISRAVRSAVALTDGAIGAVRIDSGNLAEVSRSVRAQLDRLGATQTRIIATSDLDEYAVQRFRNEPIDAFGIGTQLVTGSGSPTVGFVYKMVERENADGTWIPVAKKSADKSGIGGRKRAVRTLAGGVATTEVVLAGTARTDDPAGRALQQNFVRDGSVLEPRSPAARVVAARERHRGSLAELDLAPGDALDGDVAIPTRIVGPDSPNAAAKI